MGSEVVILEALDEFLPSADHQIAKEVQKEFTKQGLNINLGCKVQDTIDSKDSVLVKFVRDGEDHELDFDKLIVAVGRTPNSQNTFDSSVEISLDSNGFVDVDEYCRTNIDNIWAIGDLVRGPMLAHKAEEDGVAAVEIMAGHAGHVDYALVPGIVYTAPEVATIGQTEEQLKEAGFSYTKGVFPFLANSRARATGHTDGMVKLLADKKTDKLLGAHIIGHEAGTIIHLSLIHI